jgi:hypothetical protein
VPPNSNTKNKPCDGEEPPKVILLRKREFAMALNKGFSDVRESPRHFRRPLAV